MKLHGYDCEVRTAERMERGDVVLAVLNRPLGLGRSTAITRALLRDAVKPGILAAAVQYDEEQALLGDYAALLHVGATAQ